MPKGRLIAIWALAAVFSLLAGVALLQADAVYSSVAAGEAMHVRIGILFALSGALAAVALTQSLAQRVDETAIDDEPLQEAVIERQAQTSSDIDTISTGMQALLEEIDNAYRSQQRLIRGLGHDLRSPLASIVSMTDTMQAGHFGELNETQRDAIKLMGETAQRIIGQIEVLYALSEGRDWFDADHLTHIDMSGLVKRIADGYIPASSSRGIRLAVNLPLGPVVIVSDAKAVERIVANLIDNALKFTDEGMVSVSLTVTDAGGVRVAVADTGVGIPADELHRITDEYFRASSGEGRPGTGVGLSVTHELCARLGGALEVESAVGEGSTFTVVLPASPGV